MGVIQVGFLVELVKQSCKAITLAFGDGANDMGMIQVVTVAELVKKLWKAATLAIRNCELLLMSTQSMYMFAWRN